MQSTFWKAVALTGVISVGCFVVFEVHRRMPKQEEEQVSAGTFQRPNEQQAGADHGDAESSSPVDGTLPPVQQEPEPGSTVASDGGNGSNGPGGSGWDQIPQRTDGQTTGRARDFVDLMSPATNPGSVAEGSRQFPPEEPAVREHNNLAASSPGTFDSAGAGGTTFDPTPDRDVNWAGGEPSANGPAGAGPSRATPADFSEAAIPGAEPTFAAGGSERDGTVADRDIQPVGATDAPENSATVDPFVSRAALEPMNVEPAANSSESDPTALFGPSSGGPPLDGNASPGMLTSDADPLAAPTDSADDGFPGLRKTRSLPETDMAPRADLIAAPPDQNTPTEDLFNGNSIPGLPSASDSEPPDSLPAVDIFPADNTPPEEGSLPAPGDFVPFDAAEPLPGGPAATSDEPAGIVLPHDAPAEFPVNAGSASPGPLSTTDDSPTIRISPARERRPDHPAAPPPAALPHRDFTGDGIISGDSPSGPQQPELKIEKVAPPEATIGEPLVYAIRVTNVGRSAAHEVVVEDRIPRGTTLDGTIPRAEMSDKKLLWRLGTIDPGGEQMIRIRVIPTEAGEIGSVATVRFVAEVAAATVITRPDLSLEMTAPNEVAVGEQATFHFRIVNSGAADTRDVVIRSLLPAGLEHPDGHDIEYPLGRMRAGESREIELTVLAKEAGQLRSQGLVAVGSRTYAEQESTVQVIPSRLHIRREGPARRFVGRKADYTTTVTNRSSRDLQQVTVEERLNPGLELAAMPQNGQFDARQRTITWKIPLIRPGESIPLKTSVVAQSPGTLESVVRASDAGGNKAAVASRLEVAGFSALAVDFENAGRPGPVAVGEQVSLRLTVKNRGTAAAEGVQALFEIPDHLEFVHAEGPVAYTREGQVIRFSTLDEIPAKDETSFNIVLTAAEAGTKRVTAELTTPILSEPLRNDQAVVVERDE